MNYVFDYVDWKSYTNYYTGDIVILDNVLYEAIADSKGKNPSSQPTYWIEYTE
jgi:hypothetical protein